MSSAASLCPFAVCPTALFLSISIASVDGGAFLDIFGRIIARPDTGAVDVSIETRSRWGKYQIPKMPAAGGDPVESTIRVKPEEIVELQLPKINDRESAFSNRVLSIRIRARQVR